MSRIQCQWKQSKYRLLRKDVYIKMSSLNVKLTDTLNSERSSKNNLKGKLIKSYFHVRTRTESLALLVYCIFREYHLFNNHSFCTCMFNSSYSSKILCWEISFFFQKRRLPYLHYVCSYLYPWLSNLGMGDPDESKSPKNALFTHANNNL